VSNTNPTWTGLELNRAARGWQLIPESRDDHAGVYLPISYSSSSSSSSSCSYHGELGHFMIRSYLRHPEVSVMFPSGSFCLLCVAFYYPWQLVTGHSVYMSYPLIMFPIYQYTRVYFPEDRSLHQHRCEIFKSPIRFNNSVSFLLRPVEVDVFSMFWMKASRCACNSFNVTQYTSAQSFFLSKALLKNKKEYADVYCVTLIFSICLAIPAYEILYVAGLWHVHSIIMTEIVLTFTDLPIFWWASTWS